MSFLSSIVSSVSNVVSSVVKPVSTLVSNVANTAGNVASSAVKGVGDIASGQVGKGLSEIAPAAATAAAIYASGGFDPTLAATTAPAGGTLAGMGTGAAGAAATNAALAPSVTSLGGILGAGSTALTGGVEPAIEATAPAASGLSGSLAGSALGGATLAGAAPEITASNIGSILPAAAAGSTLGSTLSSLLPTTSAGLAALGAGAGSAISGLLGANAATNAAQIQADAAKAASANQMAMFNTLNNQQAPYRSSGYNAVNQIGAMMPGQYTQYDASGKPIGQATGSGYLTQQFGPEQFAAGIDPGYAFRLQQGQMANQRASNLAGGLIGGNALQGMQDYTQGMASQEYGNAFNRYQTQRTNIYNTLAGIAGIGQTAQGQTNQMGQNVATAQGQLGVGSAAAQAAGQIGQANALGNAAGGVGNAYMLSQLLGQNQGAAGNLSGSNFMNAYNAIG